jgi:hypothetical protein
MFQNSKRKRTLVLLHPELVKHLVPVGLAGIEAGTGKGCVIRRIGKILGFEAQRGAVLIGGSIFFPSRFHPKNCLRRTGWQAGLNES